MSDVVCCPNVASLFQRSKGSIFSILVGEGAGEVLTTVFFGCILFGTVSRIIFGGDGTFSLIILGGQSKINLIILGGDGNFSRMILGLLSFGLRAVLTG